MPIITQDEFVRDLYYCYGTAVCGRYTKVTLFYGVAHTMVNRPFQNKAYTQLSRNQNGVIFLTSYLYKSFSIGVK